MYYVLCTMYYAPCAVYYVLCAMCCVLYTVTCALYTIYYFLYSCTFMNQLVLSSMFCGASGYKAHCVSVTCPTWESRLWRLYTSSRINTRRSQYTSALFNIWNVASHPTNSTWNIQTIVNQLWDIINIHSNYNLLSKSLGAWVKYPARILAFETLLKIGKNSAV